MANFTDICVLRCQVNALKAILPQFDTNLVVLRPLLFQISFIVPHQNSDGGHVFDFPMAKLPVLLGEKKNLLLRMSARLVMSRYLFPPLMSTI
jgi:hypothetical protein